MRHVLLPGLVVLAALPAALRCQARPPASHWEYVSVASGTHANPAPIEMVVWSQFVILPHQTPWQRLYFHAVNLDEGSSLRITSVVGGHTMVMRQEHMAQWHHSSCFFNGEAVLVELVAGPGTTNNFVTIQKVLAGDINPQPGTDTICGTTDNRVPSSDPRAGRIDPIGCTGWIIDFPAGVDKVHLSAGHCLAAGQVLQFDVPASQSNCSLLFPPPNKQFAIDNASSVGVNGGVGNDYWAYRCFPNPTTGRTTFEEQGSAFTLATVMPAAGATLRIYGFGVDGTDTTGAAGGNASCSCGTSGGTRNQVQQTHTAGLVVVAGSRVDHLVDTCGGNSGSPVLDNTSGNAIAIHTHGGCTTTGGSNSGTNVLHPGLQSGITAVAPPPVTNDDCTNALPVAIGVNGPFRNIGAVSAVTPFPCGANVVKDLWFQFNACSGSYTFSTCTPTRTFNTVLQVFTGACGSLTSLGCNDDAGGGCSTGSTLTVNVPAGICYIRVGGAQFSSGEFDLVVRPGEIYDAGPMVTDATAGAGGAPASVLQTGAPLFLNTLGFDANTLPPSPTSVADDFITNGPWCLAAIEGFAYQVGATAPSIDGVYLEIYDGDPSAGGQPIAGSPGFANNLSTTPGYSVSNTLTGAYRVLDTAPLATTARIQSVYIGLPTPLQLDSSTIPSGRYWLRMQFSGTAASGAAVVPITIKNLAATGDGLQSLGSLWLQLANGGYAQGVPFKLYGGSSALPGGITNLGGSCSTASLQVTGAPHVGGALRFELANASAIAVPLIALGITDPNLPFAPFCGCVQHASLDVLLLAPSVDWSLPPSPASVGLQFYTQGGQLLGPALACDIGVGFRFELTNAFRVRLY